jgi:sodium/bile acid cotransporter 7
MRFRSDFGFLLGLCAAILLAFWRPAWGAGEDGLPVAFLRPAGVFVIFFSQGLGLSLEALRRGMADWRLHLCVQGCGYLLAPLLALLLIVLAKPLLPEADLRSGFLYLAILPTTITSAVVLTSAAGGDTAGALFNTTLSNVAGVFIVPAFCLLFLLDGRAEGGGDPGPVFASVALQILLPLALGQALRPVLGRWAEERRQGLRALNLGIVCFLVYAAFCASVLEGIWADLPAPALAAAFLIVLLFVGLLAGCAWMCGGLFRLAPAARLAAFFCGSQKTLAAGLPLAASIFGGGAGGPDLGLIILPLLICHPAQLILGGWLMPRLRVG